MSMNFEKCTICPRKCGVNRSIAKGFCGQSDRLKIARAALHFWEEPVISGKNGSGAIFFTGCPLKCCFCQNHDISQEDTGTEISVDKLRKIMLRLQDEGANNINLVTPTHFTPLILEALDGIKCELHIPVVYNCGGYESVETIKALTNYVGIFLPDFKYFSSEISKKYSNAEDYFEVASKAIKAMFEITGKPVIENGLMKKGIIVRHMVLPNNRNDSIAIVNYLGKAFASDEIMLSLMSQYTPFYKSNEFKEISRRLSTFEYNSVVKVAEAYGFDGFIQDRKSSARCYIPPFSNNPDL